MHNFKSNTIFTAWWWPFMKCSLKTLYGSIRTFILNMPFVKLDSYFNIFCWKPTRTYPFRREQSINVPFLCLIDFISQPAPSVPNHNAQIIVQLCNTYLHLAYSSLPYYHRAELTSSLASSYPLLKKHTCSMLAPIFNSLLKHWN